MTQLFLIELDSGKRIALRLPCDKHGGMTETGERRLHEKTGQRSKHYYCLENILTRFRDGEHINDILFDALEEHYG